MKIFSLLLLVCLLAASCATQNPTQPEKRTLSSFDRPTGRAAQRVFNAGAIHFENADLPPVLALYQEISGRTVVKSAALPPVKLTLRNEKPLNRVEALQLLDTALAQQQVTMVLVGDNAVKAVPTAQVVTESPPLIEIPEAYLPPSSSFMMRMVTLKSASVDEAIGLAQPFAALPNSIIANKDAHVLVLRDYSSNIRQMLRVINDLESSRAQAPRVRKQYRSKR